MNEWIVINKWIIDPVSEPYTHLQEKMEMVEKYIEDWIALHPHLKIVLPEKTIYYIPPQSDDLRAYLGVKFCVDFKENDHE